MNRSTLLFTTEFYRYLSLRWLVLFFLIILGVSTAKADYDNWGSSGLQLSGEAVLSPDHNYVDFEVLMGEKSGQYDWIRAHVFVTYNNGQASERLGHMEMETFDIFDYVGKVEKINVNVDEDDLCRITFRYTPSSRILNLPNLDGIKIRGFWTQSDNCEYDIYNNTITNGSDYYTIEKKISISVGALNYPRGELYRPAPGKVAFKASGIPSYNKGNRRTKYNFCDDEKYNYFEQHILNPGETKIDHTITKRTYNNRDSYNIYILAISEDGDSRFDEKKGFVTVKGCSYAENAIANIQDENKWVPKVTISWDRCHTSSAYNVDGKWYIFRKEEGQNDSFYTNIGNVSFATSTYTDDNAEYNKKYVYCVSYYLNAWSTPDAPIRDLCSTTNTVSTFFNFPITLTTESGSNSITLRLQHPTFNNTNYTFKIFRKRR